MLACLYSLFGYFQMGRKGDILDLYQSIPHMLTLMVCTLIKTGLHDDYF